jgi:RNA polymerase-binding transcription factor DksA
VLKFRLDLFYKTNGFLNKNLFYICIQERKHTCIMADKKEKTRYSPEELKEFEELILQKLRQAEAELEELKRSMMKLDDAGTSDTEGGNLNLLEDGADTLEKESINQLAARQQKFINQLRMALVRIKNGTYGICVDTGKLIPKERLRIVPHTQHSIEAKLNKD